MGPVWLDMNRWLTWFHRWAGVVLCLLFAVWFASGAVLHFVGFPSLPADEQHAGSEAIDGSLTRIDPSAALALVPEASDLRLISVAGRPVYVAKAPSGTWVAVAADTGELMPTFPPAVAKAVAEFFGRAAAVGLSGPVDYDQWIVHQRFDPYRPFYRVRLNDAERTDLYVSSRTGEVLQRTHLNERAWNWGGAVIHWIYFTPLRKSWSAWNQVVWWISLVALLSSSVGTWLGFLRMAGNRAAGRRGLSPFRGWMRWHHIIGLFASLIVVTWILSGWLSMDHGRLFSRGEASRAQADRMSGMSLDAIARAATSQAMAQVSPASSISFNAIAGQPFLTAYGRAEKPRIVFLSESRAGGATSLPDSLLAAAVNNVWHGASRAVPDAYDELYRRAESTGDSAAAFTVGDAPDLRLYVDRFSGRVLVVMDASRRGYAWIYYALHTLQFPGLISHPDIRTATVLSLLALGFAFSITGVILSILRLRREFA
jgi:uncharacterized iron-regulated membrane protein